MNKLLLVFVSVVLFLSTTSFTNPEPPVSEGINWMSWEDAVAANEKEPRKIMVDLYTHWCGWCKVMDKKTFSDKAVIDKLNKEFYAVKFDAEQKEDVQYAGKTFTFIKGERKGGVHELAYSLVNGKMSYPTIVYLNEKFERISISPGYKEIPDLINELEFASGEHYLKGSFEKFLKEKN